MKTALAYVWQRRWCRLLIAAVVLCALPLVHPFVRQSVFGPTIDGIPWCVWENEIRHSADRGPDPWLYKLLKKVGLVNEQSIGQPRSNAETLPFWIHVAGARDAHVRRAGLDNLARMPEQFQADTEPVFRRHLDDRDPQCRILAARGLWEPAREKEPALDVAIPLTSHADAEVRRSAASLLAEMAPRVPETFEPLAGMIDDSDRIVRWIAIESMGQAGARGVPILQKALRSQDLNNRRAALHAIPFLKEHAEPLIPMVTALQNDPGLAIPVSHALYRLDPKRFARPANWPE